MLVMAQSSPAGDDAVGVTWSWRDVDVESCWQRHCRDELATTRCRCRIMLTTMILSRAGNDTAGTTWSWRDIDVDSCWRQCYRVMLTTTLPM
jgi:hypothetical protein